MAGRLANVSTLPASVGGAIESALGPAISTCAAERLPVSTSSASSNISSTPSRYGGAMRGNGGRPSITSSSAVSSPKRYSSGPVTTETGTVAVQPSASISAMAASRRRTTPVNAALVAMITESAPTAWAAMSAPSSTRYGSRRRISRSLRQPGSPSAALTTTVGRITGDVFEMTVCHFRPGGEAGAATTAESGGGHEVDDGAAVDGAGVGQALTGTGGLRGSRGRGRRPRRAPARGQRVPWAPAYPIFRSGCNASGLRGVAFRRRASAGPGSGRPDRARPGRTSAPSGPGTRSPRCARPGARR